MRERWLGVALLAASAFAGAAAPESSPLGAPQPDKTLRDPEFGVAARHIGLERVVQMLQWQRAAGGYIRIWSAERIDSSTFAPGHENPGALPLQGRRWLARAVTVDGSPLAPDVISRLGAWEEFRPNFSALPGNLSATFQPEGNGLGSAENPLAPHVGDLRIHWHDLALPSLEGRVALQGQRWHLVASQPGRPAAPKTVVEPVNKAWPQRSIRLLGVALIVLIAAFAVRRRHKP